jgi:hypothetical protein
MTKIELEIHEDVVSAINKFLDIKDSGIELEIPEGSVLFENVVNIKLIKKEAEKKNIVVQFRTTDPVGERIIAMAEDKTVQETVAELMPEKKGLSFPTLPSLGLSTPKLPRIPLGKLPFILGVFLILLGGSGYYALNRMHRAAAKIIVNAQPLTRSITVRVLDNTTTDAETKILRGTTLNVSVEDSLEIETTGEKTVGEKAEGEAIVYNRTTTEKEFKKGTVLVYEDIKYEMKEDVTVPASKPEDVNDPASPMVAGEAIVEIEAVEIGDDSNTDGDKTLEFDDYEKTDYIAKTNDDIEGGKSEKVKIVSSQDILDLEEQLTEKTKGAGRNELNKKVSEKQTLVEGSQNAVVSENTFSHEEGEETDSVSLTQKVSVTGLIYYEEELNNLMDKLSEDIIPDNYTLSEKERTLSVEVLGESTNSTLSSYEADLQVTLKTYVVPKIDPEKVKANMAGKTKEEAQEILGSIRNVKTYEFRVMPDLPFFNKTPTDLGKIEVIVERE